MVKPETATRTPLPVILLNVEKLYACAQKLGFELSQRQLEQFSVYYHELIDWNRRINLTAITGYEEVQIKHFCDSLSVILGGQPFVAANRPRVLDVGTGAGFPGIPLKILLPGIGLVLLESVAKKGAFLRHLVEKLGLENVEVVIGRAEEIAHLTEYREKFDIVLSRGVAPLPTLVELTLPLCKIGGSSIAQKKGNIDVEVAQAATAMGVLGGSLREIKRVELDELAGERYLVIIDKVSPTPVKYPRRPGIPAKRPL